MLNVQNYFEIKILLLFISKQFYLFFTFFLFLHISENLWQRETSITTYKKNII